jgi:hypothetical protein
MTQFWKKVRKAVQGAAEDGAEALREGASAVAERAPKAAAIVAGKSRDVLKLAELKIQIRNLNIQAEQRLSELGGRVYEVLGKGAGPVADDAEVRSLVEKVRDLERRILEAEKAAEGLRGKAGPERAEGEAVPGPTPVKKSRPRRPMAKPAAARKPRRPARSGQAKGSAVSSRAARSRKPPGRKAT